MNLNISKEWLARKLAKGDDSIVAVGGMSMEQFEKDVKERMVTPSALASVPTELGKAIRFVREQKGWSISELAQLAAIEESDLHAIETMAGYEPTPRTITQLADACHFSRPRLMKLAGHRTSQAANEDQVRYAANSKGTQSITDVEYEAIRVLVQVLSDRGQD